MRRNVATPETVIGSSSGSGSTADPSAPHFYNPNAALTLPVTIQQVARFKGQDAASAPTLVLPDGSHYYGDVDVPGRIGIGAVPHGVGIILFKAASRSTTASSPSPPPPQAATTSSGRDEQAEQPGAAVTDSGIHDSSSSTADALLTTPAPSVSGNYNTEQTCQAFDAGDRYGGSWSFGLFEGNGVLITSTFTYQGNWSAGKMHGKGHMLYNKNFVDRMPGGAGLFEGGVGALLWRGLSMLSPFEDSAHKPKEYLGDFDRTQLRHGYGLLRYYNGDVYEGHWCANRRHGKGKFTQADGEVYEGNWENDVRQGYGTIQYPDGKKFKGHLQRGEREGEGVLVYANGDAYYGHFSHDSMQGDGTMRYKNGDLYEGEWKDGMRNGKGKYTLKKKKSIVQGTFVNGLIHGPGTVENPGISLFVGLFVRGERSEGTMFFFQGAPGELQHVACYQGEWVSERIQGKGLMWFRNGDFYFGQFQRNERCGQGNMRYAQDRSEYSGGFHKNRREGWGVLQRGDGVIKAGRWSADQFIEGYEGEWDGEQLNGVGHLRLSFETFVFGPQENDSERASAGSKKKGTATIATTTSESPIASDTGGGASGDHDGRNNGVVGVIPPGEAVEFFGLFKCGRRDGPGVLRVPAVLSELFPSLPVPSYRQVMSSRWLAASTSHAASGQPRKKFFFFASAAQKAAAAEAAANAEAVAAARQRRRACGVAEDVQVGDDAMPVCPARHVIKGRWRDGVLHCEKGVWAFPSGEVYVGGFANGKRESHNGTTPSVMWRADGSVHVGRWQKDAPIGDGLYFAKNVRNPIVSTVASLSHTKCQKEAGDGQERLEMSSAKLSGEAEPARRNSSHDSAASSGDSDEDACESQQRRTQERASQTKREASLRAASSSALSSSSTTAATAAGLGTALNFFSYASSADAVVKTAAKTTTNSSTDGTSHEQPAQNEDGGVRRVLVGFGNHYIMEAQWRHSSVSAPNYFYGLQPPLFRGPRPVDANSFSTIMDALGYLPEAALLHHAADRSADSARAAGSIASFSSASRAHSVSSQPLALPPSIPVGRVDDRRTRVWFYDTGVCLESFFFGNHAGLAIPHRPGSRFDVSYLQELQRIGAVPAAYCTPSQQSQLTAWLSWHRRACDVAIKEQQKRDVEQALLAALQSDLHSHATAATVAADSVVNDATTALPARPKVKTMDAEARALLESGPPDIVASSSSAATTTTGTGTEGTVLSKCTFCGKQFGLFRRATQCTLCFRVSCSACLGNLDLTPPSTDGASAPGDVTRSPTSASPPPTASSAAPLSPASLSVSPVHATALRSYALLQAAFTKSEEWNKEKPDNLLSLLNDVPVNVETYRDELIAQGVSTVPTCGDCVRALLLKMQIHTIWIPSALFPNAHVATTCWANEAAQTHTPRDGQTLGMRTTNVAERLGGERNSLDVHAHESTRRTADSVEASLPSQGYSLPGSSAHAAQDTVSSDAEDVKEDVENRTPLDRAHSDSGKLIVSHSTGEASPAPQPPADSHSGEKAAERADVHETNSPSSTLQSLQEPHENQQEQQQQQHQPRPSPAFHVVYSGYTTGQLVPHLYGEMWWGERVYYRGGFQSGLRHGFGTQIFCASGEKYVGEFQQDAWHGLGLFFYADGSVLQGVFCQNDLVCVLYRGEVDEHWQRHGRGVAYDIDDDLLHACRHGKLDSLTAAAATTAPSETLAAGDADADFAAALSQRVSYNGEWVHGVRHGTGLYQCYAQQPPGRKDGPALPVIYSGEFTHDVIHGTGKLVTSESAYYGQFIGNEKHGKGVEFFADMAIEGMWSHGSLDGFCKLFYSTTETVYETTYALGNERDDCFAPPLMVSDNESTVCGTCKTAFSLFTRRHHCRLCGGLFCDACSQKRAQLPSHVKAGGTGQQRVCDDCFDRLSQRRSVAICRYRDGSVYAGCWSQGRWVSRGVFCRADGLFFVFNHKGELLTGADASTASPEHTVADPVGAQGERVKKPAHRCQTPPLCDEVLLSRTALNALTVSSPVSEADKFVLWWAGVVTRCQLHVALDIPLLQRLQQLRRTEAAFTGVDGSKPVTSIAAGTPLAMKLSAVVVRSALSQQNSRLSGETKTTSEAATTSTVTTPEQPVTSEKASASFFLYPKPPSQPALHLFVPFQAYLDAQEATHGDKNNDNATCQDEPSAPLASGSRVMGGDDAIHAAAYRASLYIPAVPPPCPVYPSPPSQPSALDSTATTRDGEKLQAVEGAASVPLPIVTRPLFTSTGPAVVPGKVPFPQPPTFAAHDVEDEVVLREIAEERVNRFYAFPPPSQTATEGTDHGLGSDAEAASMPLLTSYSHKPLLQPTPLPPESGTNVKVPWSDFSTRSAAALIAPFSQQQQQSQASSKAPFNLLSSRKGRQDGRDSSTQEQDLRVLFACSFLPPEVPDVQQTLEIGKVRHVADLLLSDEAASHATGENKTGGGGNECEDDVGDNNSIVRAAWRSRCQALLNTVPSTTQDSVRDVLRKGTEASPFSSFFLHDSYVHMTRGCANCSSAGKKKRDGVSRVADKDTSSIAVGGIRSDAVGWLPRLFRGPLENTIC